MTVVLLMSLLLPDSGSSEETRADVILHVGAQDDIKTRNLLLMNDIWTRSVLFPLYSTVALFAPGTEELMPYLLKGIDADDDGIFELSEYGVFEKATETNRSIVTAYYDFNEVYFHDGVQATMEDLLFSYHLLALDPLNTPLDVLKDANGWPDSNFSSSRWLWVYPVDDMWDPLISVGEDDTLTFALHFESQASYSGFSQHTLGEMKLLPRHLWESTGKMCLQSEEGLCSYWEDDLHDDHGLAVDPTTSNGIPQADPQAFKFDLARLWCMEDDEVIGTGPFEFDEWDHGMSVHLVKFEDFYASATDRNGDGYLTRPNIDGIRFKIYKTSQAAVFALQAGEIDVISWEIPPEFINWLLRDPNIELGSSVGQSFAYVGYDMTASPFGYPNNDPSQGDDGLYLRKAIAHLIDKETVVTSLLQNYGYPGDQPVSPSDTLLYNESVQKYQFHLLAAEEILDDYYTLGGLSLGYGVSGYRRLPTIGDKEIGVSCPIADFDPLRGQACSIILSNMRAVRLNAVWRTSSVFNGPDYDIWIGADTRSSDLVEYYYKTFHSRGGLMHQYSKRPGFQNTTFDTLVEEARREFNVSKQIRLAKQCSGMLADALPYDYIYFRTNAEAYRSDKFLNWTMGRMGSIIRESFWSLIGIHPPMPKLFGLSVWSASAVKSGEEIPVTATARFLDGVGMAGANVEICVSTLDSRVDPGNLSFELQRGRCVNGLTNINGDLIVGYEAPLITVESARAYFLATAEAEDFGKVSAKGQTTVYAGSVEFLSIMIEMMAGDVVFAGDSLPMSIEVIDQQGLPVAGTVLTLVSSPDGLVFSPSGEITLGEGSGMIWVEAPLQVLDGEDELYFMVTVTASAQEYGSFDTWKEITVVRSKSPPDEPESNVIDDWTVWLISLLLAAIGISALVRYVHPPRKQ